MLRALSRLQVENNQSQNVSVAPNLPPDLQFLIEIAVIIVCEVIKLRCWGTANAMCSRFLLRNHYHHLRRGNTSRFILLKNISEECPRCRLVSTSNWSSTQTFEWEEQRTSNLERISVAFLLHCITWFRKHLFGLKKKKWHKNVERRRLSKTRRRQGWTQKAHRLLSEMTKNRSNPRTEMHVNT